MKQDNGNIRNSRSRVLLAFGLVALISACGMTTHQVRSTETSGFLENYAQLQKGADNEALLVYLNQNADFQKYDKILFEPIKVYTALDSNLAEVPKEDIQSLVNYLDATIRNQLKSDYTFVTEPGPGVMRFRVAITEAAGSNVVRDTMSSILPIGMVITGIKKIAVGTHTNVGMARIEGEIIDSLTGKRLFAAVDERSGNKYTGKFDKWETWKDTKDSYDYWAERLKKRLAGLRGEV